ncbi:glycoside hydrolase family 15 [Candidatus Woesearchaeota archaeon]|nr:glycoside hydrolase family 15 [Candidatus Woesearchaeota archaeon]
MYETIKKHPLNYDWLMKQHLKILKGLQYKSGLFAASSKEVGTGYDKAWLRDNFYECMAFEIMRDWRTVKKTYRALLDIFLKHEYKIDWAIQKKPEHKHEYIHARFNPDTFDEFWEEWGNKQNDAIGAILFKIGELEGVKKGTIIENENDKRIVQKLVWYLGSIEYWNDKDSGIWEEDEELHASSVGACAAGLRMIKKNTDVVVDNEIMDNGIKTLRKLLPRESKKKFVDLALLSLIYPYGIVTKSQTKDILQNVEYHLLKRKGVIRYKNDHYYNKNPDGYSEEAEWTFGLSWLSIIYGMLGNKEKEKEFLEKALSTVTSKGVPELYYSNSDLANENNPLGWSESLLVVALYEMNRKHFRMLI